MSEVAKWRMSEVVNEWSGEVANEWSGEWVKSTNPIDAGLDGSKQ